MSDWNRVLADLSQADRDFAQVWRFELKHRSATFCRVFVRDRGRCWICNKFVHPGLPDGDPKSGTVDHVHALMHGGSSMLGNLRLAHSHCNNERGAPPPWYPVRP